MKKRIFWPVVVLAVILVACVIYTMGHINRKLRKETQMGGNIKCRKRKFKRKQWIVPSFFTGDDYIAFLGSAQRYQAVCSSFRVYGAKSTHMESQYC